MKISTVNFAGQRGVAVRSRLLSVVLLTSWALLFVPAGANAGELAIAQEQLHSPYAANGLEGASAWMKDRFSQSEINASSGKAFGVEAHDCNCADKSSPHFPYRIVLFTTLKSNVAARPVAHEQTAKVTLLAVRNGDQYCALESEAALRFIRECLRAHRFSLWTDTGALFSDVQIN